jgi:hypothetical protein
MQILSGIFTLRLAVGGAKTQQQHVDDTWSLIKSEADRLLAKQP